MFKNSNELLEYALREIQVAVRKNKPKVEIILKKYCSSNAKSVKRYCKELGLEEIIQALNKEFENYNINGTVELAKIATVRRLKEGSIEFVYPLTWILILRKK